MNFPKFWNRITTSGPELLEYLNNLYSSSIISVTMDSIIPIALNDLKIEFNNYKLELVALPFEQQIGVIGILLDGLERLSGDIEHYKEKYDNKDSEEIFKAAEKANKSFIYCSDYHYHAVVKIHEHFSPILNKLMEEYESDITPITSVSDQEYKPIGFQSSQASKKLIWNRKGTDLVELMVALYEVNAFKATEGDVERKDIYALLMQLFNCQIADIDNTKKSLANRNDETRFMDKLEQAIDENWEQHNDFIKELKKDLISHYGVLAEKKSKNR